MTVTLVLAVSDPRIQVVRDVEDTRGIAHWYGPSVLAALGGMSAAPRARRGQR